MRSLFAPLIAGLLFLFVVPVYAQTFAGSLLFSPTSKTINVNDTVDIQVNINTGTDEVNGADAYITFDPNVLEYQSVSNGSFFPQVFKSVKSSSLLYIGGLRETGTVVKGSGTIATITFKGKANGTATLSYNCGTGGTSDSSIIKTDSTNVIACGSNGTSAITVGSGGSNPTATPTPTTGSGSGGATATPTPKTSGSGATATPTTATTKGGLTATTKPTGVSQLPQSGVVENMSAYIGLGTLLFFLGIGARFLL
jgi:hypothetical protein